ncbi:unnamed protein product [Vicia faba]|uniref:Uncharacterized protein n=1 Tax=Vicia faba TaxID=3906 RepID=A0AAV0ZRD3_VICFA|nr:unnamed protein product [Vicia faba]
MEEKLWEWDNAYNESQKLLQSLQKDEKMGGKDEKEVLELTEKAVSTSGVYFERVMEHVLFLYPNLGLSPVNFLKVVGGDKLVDEEVIVSLKLRNPASVETAQRDSLNSISFLIIMINLQKNTHNFHYVTHFTQLQPSISI